MQLANVESALCVAMCVGLLIQNVAEWRDGGPLPPDTRVAKRLFPPITDQTRLFALIIVSILVPLICIIALLTHVAWPMIAIAAALIVNAFGQLAMSLATRQRQPGTITGMVFMLPPSVAVIVALWQRASAWVLLLGPVASVPLLVAIWWVAHRLGRWRAHRD